MTILARQLVLNRELRRIRAKVRQRPGATASSSSPAGEYQTRDLLVWQTDRISPDGKVEGRFVLKNKPTFFEQAAIANLPLPKYE